MTKACSIFWRTGFFMDAVSFKGNPLEHGFQSAIPAYSLNKYRRAIQ
jgi:hypothetical protein